MKNRTLDFIYKHQTTSEMITIILALIIFFIILNIIGISAYTEDTLGFSLVGYIIISFCLVGIFSPYFKRRIKNIKDHKKEYLYYLLFMFVVFILGMSISTIIGSI